MNPKTVEKLLQTTKRERRGGAPREDWVTRNREILLMQVRNTTDASARPKTTDRVRHLFGIFMPLETVMVTARAFGIFLIMAGTVLGGGLASAQLYSGAVPGDTLYGVKVAVERVQLKLAPNSEYALRLHTEFADRRMEEIVRLAEFGEEGRQFLPDVLASFEADVMALADGLAEMQVNDPDAAVETARLAELKMTLYQNMLAKVASSLPADTRMAVNVTRNRVDDTAILAMSVIVEKHVAGVRTMPRTVMVSKFEDRLDIAERSLNSVIADREIYEEQSKAIRAKTAIAEAKLLLEEENYQAALSKIVEVAELTHEAEEEAVEEELAEEEEGSEAEGDDMGEENKEEENESAEPAGSSEAEASEDAVGSGSR